LKSALLVRWNGFRFARAAGIYNAAFDFYGDGQIDILDFARFRSQYGKMLP
jgi:hypothetical protein